ncbi:MAG: ABC transporter substrate-binding protein [Candidatus Bathyarchaeales archaeon]
MDKRVILAIVLSMLMIFTAIASVHAMPPITDKLDLKVATIEGGNPETVDPAWAYDTASGELIFNVYDTLITFDGEHMETYLPSIATSWTIQEINETSPEGLHWYYRYTFQIRSGVKFYDTLGHVYDLTPHDVEYSFEREMVQDRDSGPQWMLYEPLLNTWGAYGFDEMTIGGFYINMSTPEGIAFVGKLIDHAVYSNDTLGLVWFNLAFPGAYAPFMQILCQTWSSILSKQWVNEYVIGTLGRHDWSGNWGDYTDWINYHTPEVSPLDDPTPVMCGTGPYMLETLSYTDNYWKVVRNTNYWRGWPANFPKLGPSQPQGYVDSLKVTWAYVWETRRDMFLAGDFDMCAVPRNHLPEMYTDYTAGKLKDGIRCIYPLPTLAVDGLFFTFDIDPSTPYGKINDYGVFTEDGIPRDFFGNATWGIHTRKAFAYAFDYNRFIQEAYLGEAIVPATAIIPGLPYYDPTVKGYTFNLTAAEEEFKKVPGLWDTGFTMTILYNTGNIPRQKAAEILQTNIQSLNSKFHILVSSVDWKPYLRACLYHQVALFIIGWLADYPDAHNFAYAFYYSEGAFGAWQGYYNPAMDALVEEGIRTPDGPQRAQIYHDIQVLAVQDCPSVPIDQAIGRHFERSWVVDWYYNPIYPGVYAYNLWKWYYIPHALQETTPTYPICNHLPYDTNYDGTIDGKDISICSKAFGSNPGPPIHPRWCFRADVNNDRIVDGKDLSYISKNYGKTSTPWSYP